MSHKTFPLTREQIEKIAAEYPTPFNIYDEKAILDNVRRLQQAFAWAPEFKEYFAVKACPNPHILRLLQRQGCGSDCSSLGELIMAERSGITGEEIMFTSNDTPAHEFAKAYELGAIINFDDISHIPFFQREVGPLPELACLRYNPGAQKEGNVIIGNPEEAKYGFTREQIFQGYQQLKKQGVKRFGLHTMVASNELNPDYFVETAQLLFDLVNDLEQELGIEFEFINLGGGIGIPYRPEQEPVDLEYVGAEIHKLYQDKITSRGRSLKIYMEMGRMITGPYGYLVSRVLHKKETYKNYIGLDSSMADLMRPGMYGAYHHISIPGKEETPADYTCDVTGSLCENNDKFAIDRTIPEPEEGDLLVIHDAGAHGHAMGFNYNAKLRSAELLLRPDGSVVRIRRGETVEDYLATLDFSQKV